MANAFWTILGAGLIFISVRQDLRGEQIDSLMSLIYALACFGTVAFGTVMDRLEKMEKLIKDPTAKPKATGFELLVEHIREACARQMSRRSVTDTGEPPSPGRGS